MEMANSAMMVGAVMEKQRKAESVQDAALYTAAALQDMNRRLAAIDEAQKAEYELNKQRDKSNAKIASVTKWIAIATLAVATIPIVVMIIGWFIK